MGGWVFVVCRSNRSSRFVSSDGIIVVAGKEAQQNEQLVRRYLRKDDVFVHGDMHGAATCVVRRPSSLPATEPIPPATIDQVGDR